MCSACSVICLNQRQISMDMLINIEIFDIYCLLYRFMMNFGGEVMCIYSAQPYTYFKFAKFQTVFFFFS